MRDTLFTLANAYTAFLAAVESKNGFAAWALQEQCQRIDRRRASRPNHPILLALEMSEP